MRMWFGIRILPLTMFMALMLLGIKVGDVVRGSHDLSEALIAGRVEAEPADTKPAADAAGKKEPEKTDAKKEPEKKEAGAKEGEAKPADQKDAKKEGEAGKDQKAGGGAEAKKGGGKKADEPKKEPEPKIDLAKLSPINRKYSPVELEVLQNLTARREELDEWERNIEVKENLLQITEKRLDDKIAQIEALKKEAGEILAQYNEKEDAKIRSLVKIYENMKPKDAARIFEELDMPILLLVADRMSEKKAAPILASMDPTKAKQLTVQLAEERKMHGTTGVAPISSAAP